MKIIALSNLYEILLFQSCIFSGAHIEGPFISVEKKGAHPEENLRQFPNGFSDLIDLYGNLDNVAMITIAPELDRSDEVIKELVKRGISVSLGMNL